ncbi:MAG: RdgB/HAM1 family non-canonical purine NTP pyrophosphatase [Melioribacteraceae bacterium]|nr:RdgB/HAM1 family non-canonical purine NTP pyrophosphatase [Melioribacteraceae bacterium]
MKVVFATNNAGKLREVRSIFEDLDFEIISLKEMSFYEEIKETGSSFEENAFIKADRIFDEFEIPVIADDSGLMVDQLGGEPGVYSARYAGENVSYDDNNKKLLMELSAHSSPHIAKFLCCAVFVDLKNRISVTGELEGEILYELKGSNGFGYDPVFQPLGFNKTLAEMSLSEKNRISHRAKAFNKLHHEVKKIISQQ